MRGYATKVWLRDKLDRDLPLKDIVRMFVGTGNDKETLYCDKIVVTETRVVGTRVDETAEGYSMEIPMYNVAGMVFISGARAGTSTDSDPFDDVVVESEDT